MPKFIEGDIFRIIVPLDDSYSYDFGTAENKSAGKVPIKFYEKLTNNWLKYKNRGVKKMKKMMIILGGSFLGIGIIMLIVSFMINSNSKKFYNTAVKTRATIEYIDKYQDYNGKSYRTRHDVYISYQTVDGDLYEDVKLGYYTSGMREGQTLTVYYDPQDPMDVRAKEGTKLAVWIVGGLGALFSVAGGMLLIAGVVSRR